MPKKVSPRLQGKLPKLPTKPPKPTIPGSLKPLGASQGESDPAVSPRNSQKAVKQRVGLNVPGVKLL